MNYTEGEPRRLGDGDLAEIVLLGSAQGKTSQEIGTVLPSVEVVVARHVDRYFDLGFHKEVYPDLGEGEAKTHYRKDFTLPEGGVKQPEKYKGRFDVLLVVDPRIPLKRQYKLLKITEYIDTSKIINLTPVGEKPYIIWTHDATRYRPYTVDDATARFDRDEVGSSQMEVTSLYLHYPGFFKDYGVDAAGSRFKYDVTCLDTFLGKPAADARWFATRGQRWGVLSRGKEIIELG